MDTIIDMLYFPNLFKCGFAKKSRYTGDGPIRLMLKQSCGEGEYLLKPIGKSLVVSAMDFHYQVPFELAWEQPEYFHISLCRGTMQGILRHSAKNEVYDERYTAGFHHCGVEVSLLTDFFDTFLGSRHGISRDELVQALAALNRPPPPPEAVVILKQIGDAVYDGNAGNPWFEAKTLELLSSVLDWHRRLEAIEPPQLTEYDQMGIAETLRYVEEHLADPLSLNTLAKLAAMSISKFTATFKRHTGLSAATYLSRFRMEKAANMLKNTSVPIGEIAAMVGYKHHASFSAAFQEQFGIIPSAFRKKDDREKNK
jgi:AraC-like DNA-binding protein